MVTSFVSDFCVDFPHYSIYTKRIGRHLYLLRNEADQQHLFYQSIYFRMFLKETVK